MGLFNEKTRSLKKVNLQDWLFSLSLSNFFFIKLWDELIFSYVKAENRYLFQKAASSFDYVAAILSVLLVSLAIYGLCQVIRGTANKSLRSLAMVILSGFSAIAIVSTLRLLGVINDAIVDTIKIYAHGKPLFIFVVLLIIGFTAYALVRWGNYYQTIADVIRVLFIIFSPFCLVTLGQSVYYAVSEPFQGEFVEQSLAPLSSTNTTHRVVIFLFDEMDYRLAFSERPAGVSLPTFDRFQKSALIANHATSPSNTTAYSIPSLLAGKMYHKIEIVAANNFLLTDQESGKTGPWKETATIFSEIRKSGGNSGLVGWSHPYQRITQKDLAFCHVYYPDYQPHNSNTTSFIDRLLYPLTMNIRVVFEQRKIDMYSLFLEDSINLSINPQLQLVFIHFPYPHLPYIFNREKNHIEPMNRNPQNYFGNLVLADRTLMKIWTRMERNGLWDKSMVVVTSDHWWRHSKDFDGKEDHRVPFMVKLPDQTTGHIYHKKFNTVIMKDMILAFLNGEVFDAGGLAFWLDRHGKEIKPVLEKLAW